MSCSYAENLSPYYDKGVLGVNELFDSEDEMRVKVKQLAKWIESSNHVVVHTGAGISTSAGIPDFRGPNGVWTLEKQGKKPKLDVSFDEAVPTPTHMALVELVRSGKVKYVISQNIDGLHLRSGLPRSHLAELHGNMFIEQCSSCQKQFVMNSATNSVGQKCLGRPCLSSQIGSRQCRGKTKDTLLDWEHSLPPKDLEMSDYHSSIADLSICLGTTLQIVPSGNLPLRAKKQNNGKLVICNLQPTKHDKKADLIIHYFADQVMSTLMEHLDLKIPKFDSSLDPTKSTSIVQWTIPSGVIASAKQLYKQNVAPKTPRKKSSTRNSICLKKKKIEIKSDEGENA